jgi:hypothetical protein
MEGSNKGNLPSDFSKDFFKYTTVNPYRHASGKLSVAAFSRLCEQVTRFHGSWPHRANHNPHPPEAQNTEVAYEERVAPWRWQLAAETCRSNFMSIIKAYNALELLLLSCTGKYKNARYNYQEVYKTVLFHIIMSRSVKRFHRSAKNTTFIATVMNYRWSVVTLHFSCSCFNELYLMRKII